MWANWVIVLLAVSSINSEELDSSEHGVRAGKVQTNCTCGLSNKSPKRIIKGHESDMNEWPMAVGMILFDLYGWKNWFICGGTIITEHHIVTAAHCLHDDNGNPVAVNEIGFLLGAHDLTKVNYDNPAAVRKAKKFVVHPEYIWPAQYDLAIVVLPKITFSKTIMPACLPTDTVDIINKSLTVVGWGYTTPQGPGSDVLKKTKLIGSSRDNCKRYSGMFDDKEPYQICTSQPGTSQCQGDSGGPLMWVDPSTNRYTLVAVVSFGDENCHKYPQVSSSISYFLPWIQQTISETSSGIKTCAKAA